MAWFDVSAKTVLIGVGLVYLTGTFVEAYEYGRDGRPRQVDAGHSHAHVGSWFIGSGA